MSKETIPQSIIDKINEQYPKNGLLIDNARTQKLHEAAIWGYGLSEGRIKELEEKVGELTQDNMTHEYNNAEAERTWPQLKEQIIEEYKASDKWISVKDGLPEEGLVVLAYHSAGIEFAKYERGNFYRETTPCNNDRIIHYFWTDITHYQYLPKPPKDI